jgi:6-phosphogluconolactonase
MNDELDITLYSDHHELAVEVASQILQEINSGISHKNRFDLSLTGGSLGLVISQLLVSTWNQNPDGYSGLHIWWSDERYVPVESSERNAHPIHSNLVNQNIVVHEILASDESKSADFAAQKYIESLKNSDMDLILLGIGPDAHVASLFPGLVNVEDSRKVIVVDDSPKPPPIRISFTMKMINSASQVWMIAAGDSKAEAVTKIIEADPLAPARYVAGVDCTRLIVDTEAFFAE